MSPTELEPALLQLGAACRIAVLNHARSVFPAEAVGLLGGTADGIVVSVHPLPNTAPNGSFIADPRAQYDATRRLRAQGLQVIGVYHSHPRGTATLSPADRHFAARLDATQVVVALDSPNDPRPRLSAYRAAASVGNQ